jgi:hypothetical protein
VIVKESAKTLLLRAIHAGDEHRPPVNPRGHHLGEPLLAELADRCYEHALAHATDGESADWLIYREGFGPWWIKMLGQVALDRLLPDLRTDIAKYLENQGLAKRTDQHDNRLFVRPRPLVARTPLVLIAPSYGNPASRARFANTLDQEVRFSAPPWRDALTHDELTTLLQLHPGGTARFWGALARHDHKIDRLAPGDPILFTGAGQIQAIGKIGCQLRNSAFADQLWPPDPETGSWSNVYTVLGFTRVHDITYQDIHTLAGYSPRDVFQETRVPRPEQASALIEGLGLPTGLQEEEEQLAAASLIQALSSESTIVPPEASHTTTSQYERAARTVTLQRAEAELVAKYCAGLREREYARLRLENGWSDLYLIKEADLIEAKASADHLYVRQALGQLLDYAAHATQPISRLTALFPTVPAPSDVRLLHLYGIDCLYWAGDDEFPRLEAPEEARNRIRSAWSAPSANLAASKKEREAHLAGKRGPPHTPELGHVSAHVGWSGAEYPWPARRQPQRGQLLLGLDPGNGQAG